MGVEWGPAIGFALGGVVVGALVLWRVMSAGPGKAPARADGIERRDLEAKLDALVERLREMDLVSAGADAGPPGDERRALELEAARTLGALERGEEAPRRRRGTPKGEPVPPASQAPASSMRGFLWGVGTAAAIGLVLFLVSRSAEERAPGGAVTGNLPGEGTAPGDPVEAELASLRERLARDPADDEARLGLARLHLMRQDMMGVFNETQAVLERDPKNARALAYQALVRLAMGQGDRALSMLRQAIEYEPDLLDGYVHLMLALTRLGRPAEADAVLEAASGRFPDRAEGLKGLLARLREEGGEEGPAEGAAAPPPPGRTVSGTLLLDPSARAAFHPGAVVFVTLRDAAFGAGPPLAARRLVAGAFPLAFEIGDADSMTGQPVPETVLVEARLDSDGDPVTRPRSDPYGRDDSVAMGSTGVQIVLKARE